MTTAPESIQPSRVPALRVALEQGAMRHAQRMVNSLHPAEIASLLESLPPARREIVWEFIDPELEGDVLVELNEEVRAELIGGMDAARGIVHYADVFRLADKAQLLVDPDLAATRMKQLAAISGVD